MSIQTRPKPLLINSLTPDTVVIDNGIVTIQGLPPFSVESVVPGRCERICPEPCTPQVVDITVTVPSATCECPWAWELGIRRGQCLYTYNSDQVITPEIIYDYRDPAGATPTVNAIVDNVVAHINGNPDSVVSAAPIGAEGSRTGIRLTEKNCQEGERRSCGYSVRFTSGSVAVVTAHAGPVLSAEELGREWPILPGHFLNKPQLAYCGEYCKYVFRIDPISRVNDPHLANAHTDRYLDVEIFVRRDLPNFLTDWDGVLTGEGGLACLGDPLEDDES